MKSMIAAHTTVRRTDAVAARTVGAAVLLLPVHQTAGGPDKVFTLNDTAAFVWNLLDEARTVAELVDAVTAAYAVTGDRALRDVITLVEDLASIGAVRTTP